MKPETFKKISTKDLRPTPEWLKAVRERAKKSDLAQMTDKEIGQLCEELAEEADQERQTKQAIR